MGLQELTFLLQGMLWTLLLAATGFIGGGVFGLLVALARVSKTTWIKVVAICWIGLFQGTPLLMQLFVAYFGLPLLGLDVPAWIAVSIAFTAHASAFLGEIWRGAIQAVPEGQNEAAQALGLHASSRYFDVILPQAFKLSMPATIGFLVQLTKGTSLAAIVGFIELARAGAIISNQTYKPLLVYAIVGAMYFAICWPLSLWGRWVERKMAVGMVK